MNGYGDIKISSDADLDAIEELLHGKKIENRISNESKKSI